MGGSSRPGSTGTDVNRPPLDAGTSALIRTPSTRPSGLTSTVSRGTVRLRFPVLETFAYQFGWAFGPNRPLSEAERRHAKDMFQDSLDLEPIRIVTTALAAAPTTLGDYIRTSGPMSTATLIHELTHVWQYQHGGSGYISDSLCRQVAAWAATGSRDAAYDLTDVIRAGKPFSDYTAEQQAMIVETYYSDEDKRADPVYQGLIDEVRQRAPVAAALRQRLIYEDALFGPTRHERRDYLREERTTPEIMPLFRIEF